jgi:hypothetical protein
MMSTKCICIESNDESSEWANPEMLTEGYSNDDKKFPL